MSEPERLEINWFNAAGSALGAVSAAVVLSTLGTAGTLLGAALGSLCITIGGAVYAHSLRVTRRRVAAAQALAARRSRRSGSDTSVPAGEAGTQATAVLEREAAGESRSQMWRQLPWKRIGLVSAALFVVAMVAIVIFELSVGRSVAELTGGSDGQGGTSVPGLGAGRDAGGSDPGQDGQEAPAQQDDPDQPADQQEDPEADVTPNEEGSPPAEETTTEPSPTSSPTATTSP